MSTETETLYPEHEKLAAVKEQSQAIGEFLDFGRFTLCEPDPYRQGAYRPTHLSIQAILADWFGIDSAKLEAEKREMLDAQVLVTVSPQEQKGRRVPDDEWFELRDRGELGPGDYGLVTGKGERFVLTVDLEPDSRDHEIAQLLDYVARDVVRAKVPTEDPAVMAFGPIEGEVRILAGLVARYGVEEASDLTTGWLARCPNGVDVNLSPCHPVTVQGDGTVSVSGSILAGDWHGWLCRGVWRLA